MPLLGYAGDAIRPGSMTYSGYRGRTVKAKSDAYAPYEGVPKSMGQAAGELDRMLNEYNAKARGLEGVENARGAAAERTITEAAARADVPTITDRQIREQYATTTDASAATAMEQERALREAMGASGVTGGGLVAGTLAAIESARIAANIKARSDLSAYKATQDALDRQRAYDRSKDVADAQARAPSMLGMDALSNTIGARLGLLGSMTEFESAKMGTSASKKSSKNGLIGSIIGGGLGLIGSII